MRAPTLRHRLEYLLFRLFAGPARLLPRRMAEELGGAVGWLAGTVFRIRRADVDRHLGIAFPDRSEEWRCRVARACYRHLGREGVVTLRLSSLDPGRVRERTRIRGLEALKGALADGRGAVVVTGHLGNWEVGGAALAARGIALDAVALRQGNPFFHREAVRARERLGMRVVHKRHAPGEALRSLREGRAVALVGDQNPISGGIEVSFFGRPANTARGAATLALRTGAPLFVGTALRREGTGGGYRVTVEEVSVERTGRLEEDVRRLVQAYTSRIEAVVRRAPEQYLWQHRRWKERG